MNEDVKMRETLSALLDGEAHELELQRLLKKPVSTEALATLQRYQAVSAVLAGNRPVATLDVSAAVAAAVAAEPALAMRGRSNSPMRVVAGVAVAASIAFAVVFSAQLLRQPSGAGAEVTQAMAPIANLPAQPQGLAQQPLAAQQQVAMQPVDMNATALPSQQELDQEYQRRLNAYLLRHAEHAAMNSGQGMIPFARLAGYETAPDAQR